MAETSTRSLAPQDEVVQTLAKMEPQFKMALPPQIPADRFLRIAQTAVRQNPAIAGLDRNSLYSAFLKCAADGLLPDGSESAIVPFGGSAVYMPMVKGICKKARNSGQIKTINAQIVYTNDMYEHWIDETGEHFKHVPARGDRGEPMVVYAFAQTKDEGVFFEELSMSDIQAIEKMSKQSNGPWKGPFRTEMMRKSAIRRLMKYRVPSNTDVDDVVRRDDDIYVQEPKPPIADGQPSRLQGIIEKQGHTDTQADDIPFGAPPSQIPI